MSAIDGFELDEEQGQLPFDVGDAKQVKKRNKDTKAVQDRQGAVLRGFLMTSEGRNWFHTFLVEAGVFKNPFSSDPVTMAFNCGVLWIGQEVLREIMHYADDLFKTMMKEAEDG